MKEAKRIGIGVVGAGLIGQMEHIPNLRRLEKLYEIVGIADASTEMRRELESRGYAAYSSYQQLLDKDLDAILVAAPDQYHAEITLNALGCGKHVFCEKPLCFSVAQAEEVAAARDKAGKVVQVGYMKRFDPSYEEAFVRELLGFWKSVSEGAPIRNTVEAATKDLRLVERLAGAAID